MDNQAPNQQPRQTTVNLESTDFLKLLEETFEQARDNDGIPEARALYKNLGTLLETKQDLRQKNPVLYKDYENIILKFKFLAVPLLTRQEVEELLSKHLLFGLQIPGYEIKRAFDGFLVTFTNDLEMFQFTEQAIQSMRKNDIKLGRQPISSITGEQLAPTVGSWITEYTRAGGTKEDRGSFEQISFMTKNNNVQKLNEYEKKLLKKVLDFADWLEFPKDEPIQEDDPKLAREIDKFIKNLPQTISDVQRSLGKSAEEIARGEKEAREVLRELGYSTSQAEMKAPPPPRPKITDELLQKTKERIEEPKQKILPPPPVPFGRATEQKITPPAPLTLRGEKRAEESLKATSYKLKPDSTEDLYRKTLEELKNLREQEKKMGVGTEPPAINEALIQAGNKGKIFGGESGQMRAGESDSDRDAQEITEAKLKELRKKTENRNKEETNRNN